MVVMDNVRQRSGRSCEEAGKGLKTGFTTFRHAVDRSWYARIVVSSGWRPFKRFK